MIEVQVDVVLLLADAAALADFDRHRARDDVAGGEVLGGGRVTLHEALALGIDEIAAFAAGALGDEAARAIDAGRVELDEFHVLQRQAGAQHHAAAVAGAGMRRGAGSVGAAIAAGGEDRGLRAETMQRAVVELERDDAAADALVVHDQVDGEELDVEFGRMAQAPGRTSCAAWRGRCGRRRRRCAAPGPCRSPGSCRRTGAGRSCRPRCARTARPNARARRRRPARCAPCIRSRPGRRASPTP